MQSSSSGLARSNGIEIWYESFGNRTDPALLLIMGACCQGVIWPVEFCQGLTDQGFYVIRYDHRDAGFSTCFDFEKNPYSHLDLAKDAIGLLDFLNIEKASLVGLSMGGWIAERIAITVPNRITSLILISTSIDWRPTQRALDGLPQEEGSLSPSTKEYVTKMREFMQQKCETEEDVLNQRIDIWNLLNGNAIPLDSEHNLNLQKQFLARLRYPPGINNHMLSNHRSLEMIRNLPSKIRKPTLILHGTDDPIFPPDHGQALADAIPGSKYFLIKGMGHVPNPQLFPEWIKYITDFVKSSF